MKGQSTANDSTVGLKRAIQDRLADCKSNAYLSYDSVADVDEAVNYHVEFLNCQLPNGFPLHESTLKVGSP